MNFFQKYKKDTFEYKFLNQIKTKISMPRNLKCYFGFDFGFLSGINIYYGSFSNEKYAIKLAELFKKENIKIRLLTNIDYDYDLIVLFGYINNKQERKKLFKNKEKIMKALSFFSKYFKNENNVI